MQRWAGRLALVTGAGSGIGKATVKKLVENGVAVFGCDINESSLDQVKSELDAPQKDRFHYMKCDLRSEEEILAMFSKIKADHGGVDICVNSAGVGYKAPVLDGETWMFKNMFDINVLAYILCTRESVKQMEERGIDDGQIVFVSSMAAHQCRTRLEEHRYFTVYNATKHALAALVNGIRFELNLKKTHTRISMVCPGVVETDFTRTMYQDGGNRADELYKTFKCLTPDDVADEIVHIISRPPHVQVQDLWLRPVEEP